MHLCCSAYSYYYFFFLIPSMSCIVRKESERLWKEMKWMREQITPAPTDKHNFHLFLENLFIYSFTVFHSCFQFTLISCLFYPCFGGLKTVCVFEGFVWDQQRRLTQTLLNTTSLFVGCCCCFLICYREETNVLSSHTALYTLQGARQLKNCKAARTTQWPHAVNNHISSRVCHSAMIWKAESGEHSRNYRSGGEGGWAKVWTWSGGGRREKEMRRTTEEVILHLTPQTRLFLSASRRGREHRTGTQTPVNEWLFLIFSLFSSPSSSSPPLLLEDNGKMS